MSPRQKRLAILSALGLVPLAMYYMSLLLYVTFFLVVCCIVGYCYIRKRLPARWGLNPRTGLKVPFELPRWLWGASGVSVAQQRRLKSSGNKSELWFSDRTSRGQFGGTGIYRKEPETNSLLFSPRDFLMGSYIGKPESPTSACGRRITSRNPREQLREKLSSPNHAVYTPNRRLSFAGEPTGAANRFVITPQRHYPLPQLGVPSLGLLHPVRWEGFSKKPMLRPGNPLGFRLPVSVKIARPGHHRTFSCAVTPNTPEDRCSTESVLKILRAKCHKRVTEEDTSFTTEQKNKRSRNDSGGSAHFAFESVLPNGTPSQLVPKPGSLKIGSPSQLDESTMKRSRTSSISSGSGIQAPKKTASSCTSRNAIYSSYSSTGGLPKKRRLPLTPPVSSSGSSRPQTPEGPSKSLREEDGQSPSSGSSVKSDQEAPNKISDTSKLSPVPKVPVTTSSGSTGSGRKRRKIQLVPSKRDDVIPLPSTPQMGYTITVKDMDEDRKAAFEIVKKMMMDSAPEPVNPISPPGSVSPESPLFTNSSAAATTLSSLLAAPLTSNLDATASGAAKRNSSQHLKVSLSTTSVQPTGLNVNVSTTVAPLLPPVSQPQSSSVSVTQPSSFTRAPGQVSEASSDTPTAVQSGLLGSASQFSTPTAASNPVTTAAPASSSSPSVSNSNPLLASGFKPIFAVTTTPSATSAPESKPVQTFKPIFGTNIAGAGFIQHPSLTTINPSSAAASSNTSSVFGGSISSATIAPSVFPGLANSSLGTTSTDSTTITTTTQTSSQPALKSLFGNWSTPTTASTSSVSVPTPNTGGTFQFGTVTTTTSAAPNPAASTTASGSSTFTFGATKPDLQAASQKVFTFVQAASSQSTTTASFGGFATTSTSSTTGSNSSNTDTTTAATTSQSVFTFGKSSFQSPAAQSTFGSSAPKPAFGSTTPQSIFASPAAQPTFGSSAAQAAQPTFGSSAAQAAQPAFGSSAPQSAQPAFGSSAPHRPSRPLARLLLSQRLAHRQPKQPNQLLALLQLSRPLAPQQHSCQNLSPLETVEHHPHLPPTPPQPPSPLGQLLSPQLPASGPQLNQPLEPAQLPLPLEALLHHRLLRQPHRALEHHLRLRALHQAPSHLVALLLSRRLPQFRQHPVDLTLVLLYPSLGHHFLIILHHRWEASILGLLLQTNQHLARLHHLLARLLLQVQFPLEVLALMSKASMLFLLGLHQHLPSPSEPDRSHPEHGRGYRHAGNTTGRSNLRHVSSGAFQRTWLVALVNLAIVLL